jgi:hypothetical protein
VGVVVDEVELGQVFPPEYFGFSLSIFIPPVLHYKEKRKKLIIFLFIFITGLRWVRSISCGQLLQKKEIFTGETVVVYYNSPTAVFVFSLSHSVAIHTTNPSLLGSGYWLN